MSPFNKVLSYYLSNYGMNIPSVTIVMFHNPMMLILLLSNPHNRGHLKLYLVLPVLKYSVTVPSSPTPFFFVMNTIQDTSWTTGGS